MMDKNFVWSEIWWLRCAVLVFRSFHELESFEEVFRLFSQVTHPRTLWGRRKLLKTREKGEDGWKYHADWWSPCQVIPLTKFWCAECKCTLRFITTDSALIAFKAAVMPASQFFCLIVQTYLTWDMAGYPERLSPTGTPTKYAFLIKARV